MFLRVLLIYGCLLVGIILCVLCMSNTAVLFLFALFLFCGLWFVFVACLSVSSVFCLMVAFYCCFVGVVFPCRLFFFATFAFCCAACALCCCLLVFSDGACCCYAVCCLLDSSFLWLCFVCVVACARFQMFVVLFFVDCLFVRCVSLLACFCFCVSVCGCFFCFCELCCSVCVLF